MVDDEDDFDRNTRRRRSSRNDEDEDGTYAMSGRREHDYDDRPIRRRRRRDDDDEEGARDFRPAYPRQLTIASSIWIKVGILILICGAVLLIDEGGANCIVGGLATVILIMLFGAVFIHVGVHTLNGTAHDTLGNGTGSLIFGLIEGASGVKYVNEGETLAGLISLASCLGLLVAGVFALHARGDYLDWLAHGKRGRVRH